MSFLFGSPSWWNLIFLLLLGTEENSLAVLVFAASSPPAFFVRNVGQHRQPAESSCLGMTHLTPEMQAMLEPQPKIFNHMVGRRKFVHSSTSGALATVAGIYLPSPAVGSAVTTVKYGASPESPVAVIGANGRTGMEVVQALAKQGVYAVTFTRAGTDPFRLVKLPADLKAFVQHYPQTVALPSAEALQEAVTSSHASALIYCASASKQGGTASQVDDIGVGIAAQVAQANNARLVVISALAVDRPDSKSFQITNTIGGNFNGIMDAKRQGEDKVRQIMKSTKNYVILRPGVLLSGKGSGSAIDLELNQGDTIGGGLSRDELAQVAVAALQTPKSGIAVEVYRQKTATKLQPDFALPSGRELRSDTYKGLFEKALIDEAGMPYLPK